MRFEIICIFYLTDSLWKIEETNCLILPYIQIYLIVYHERNYRASWCIFKYQLASIVSLNVPKDRSSQCILGRSVIFNEFRAVQNKNVSGMWQYNRTKICFQELVYFIPKGIFKRSSAHRWRPQGQFARLDLKLMGDACFMDWVKEDSRSNHKVFTAFDCRP